ncbi:MAG: hypothetical protein P8X58_04950, partial [Syntrophobacterales bacterium]
LDLLQRRSGAPVVTALMQRNGKKWYTMNLVPVYHKPSATETTAQLCLKILEVSIQDSPSHWYQWKKFGQMINPNIETVDDYQASGSLALELQVPVPI